MARPSKMTEKKIKELEKLCRLYPTLKDCAAYLEVNERTIERYIKKEYKTGFVDYRERFMVQTRLKLVQVAINKAQSGNVKMLIFCLKNLCGWAEKSEIGHSSDGSLAPTTVNIIPAEFEDNKESTNE